MLFRMILVLTISKKEATREVAIREFKASSEFTDLLESNYVAGFEDFCMDALEHFPGMDFSPIKLRIVAESSLL